MKLLNPRLTALAPLITLLCAASPVHAQDQPSPPATDPGWPREFAAESEPRTAVDPLDQTDLLPAARSLTGQLAE